MRDKLVELAIPRPINSDVWFVAPEQVQMSVDGYIVDRHDLTGPAGLEDLLSRIQPLPPRPQYGDVCAEDTKIRVDARGELVVTYAFEGVELTELHANLASGSTACGPTSSGGGPTLQSAKLARRPYGPSRPPVPLRRRPPRSSVAAGGADMHPTNRKARP